MKKTILKIALVALALVVVLSAFTGCTKDPKQQLRDSITKTSEKISSSELLQLLDAAKNGGSVAFDVDVDKTLSSILMLAGAVNPISTDIELSAKTYGDAKKAAGVYTAALNVGGAPLVDFAFGAQDDKFYISSPALFGEKAYGFEIEGFGENFKNSELYKYIAESELSQVFNQETLDALFASTEYQQFELSYEKYYNLVIDTLVKNNAFTMEDADVAIGAETVASKKFTLTFNHPTFVAVMKAVVAEAKNDKALNDAINTAAASEGVTAEEMWAKVDAEIAELEAETDTEGEFYVYVYVNKKAGTIMRVDIDADKMDDFIFSIVLGVNAEKPTYSAFEFVDGEESFKLIYNVEADTDEQFKAKFAIAQNGADLATVVLDYNRKDFKYALNLAIPGVEGLGTGISLSGTYKLTKDELVFSFEKLSLGIVSLEMPMTLTVLAKDEMPAAPAEFKDVCALTREQIDALAADLQEALGTIIQNLPPEIAELIAGTPAPMG